MKAIVFALAALTACGKDSASAKSEPAAAAKPEAPKPETPKPEAPKPEAPKAEAPASPVKAEAPPAEPAVPVEVPTAADFEDRVRDVTAKNVDVHLRALEDELAP